MSLHKVNVAFDETILSISDIKSNPFFNREPILELNQSDFKHDGKLLRFENNKIVPVTNYNMTDTVRLMRMQQELFELKRQNTFSAVLEKVRDLSKVEFEQNRLSSEIAILENKIADLQKLNKQKEQQFFMQKVAQRMAKNDYPIHNAICAIAKNETPYIIEWIKYHLDLGIEHIYIYDDNSAVPIKETIKELSENYLSKITVHNLQVTGVAKLSHQRFAYAEFMRKYEQVVKWVSFLDIDEFINLKGKSPREFLAQFETSNDVGEIKLRWLTYNANNHFAKNDAPVRARFTQISPFTLDVQDIGKCFTRCAAIEMLDYHRNEIGEGLKRVDANEVEFEKLPPKSYAKYPTDDAGWIDHYYTKSLEEWEEKIARGSADKMFSRARSEFFNHNPNMTSEGKN